MLAGVAIAGLGAVAVTIYICYRFAEPTIAALGKHGTNVVVRLSAFLLLCIGIQIVRHELPPQGTMAGRPLRIETRRQVPGQRTRRSRWGEPLGAYQHPPAEGRSRWMT